MDATNLAGGGSGGGVTHLVARGRRWSDASHQRVDADVSVEGTARDDGRVTRAPLDVEAPLIQRRKLVHNLSIEPSDLVG